MTLKGNNMAGARWGKTVGAYKKFSFVFEQQLPVVVHSASPISDAVYLRDVIAYAHENGLTGKNWYRKVVCSPKDNGTVVIMAKPAFAPELATVVVKEYSLFELIHAIETGELTTHSRCHCSDDLKDINAALSIKRMTIKHYGGSLIELLELDNA